MRCSSDGCPNKPHRRGLCRRHLDEAGPVRAPAGQSVQLDGLRVRAEVAEAMVEAAAAEGVPVPEWRRRAYADRLTGGSRRHRRLT